jgi:ribosome-associated toxin RatA of RatAB toxin-antitoxin module
MSKIHREALLSYSPQAMYRLVNDVPRYPEFLPWCQAAKIIQQTEGGMRAAITIKKIGISKSFTTENLLYPNERISINFLNGPFRHLKGEWQFIPIQALGCKIILDLDFEFLPGLINLPFKKIFEPAADSMLQAFIIRAHDLYAPG